MAFLTICGITVPVASGSAEEVKREIGETEAAYDGSLKRARQAVKYDLKFETTPMVQATAFAWDGLLRGLGHSWNFNTHLYSGKGKIPAIVTGNTAGSAELKHGAGGLAIDSGSSFDPTDVYNTAAGCTVMFFYEVSVGAGFTHYITTESSAGSNNYWTNGASKTAGTPAPTGLTLGIASGNVSIIAGGGATRYVDDLVILPFVIPDDWAASIYTFHNAGAWPSIPFLTAGGDVIWDGTTRTVMGFSESSKLISGVVDSSFVVNARTLSVLLQQT